MTIFSKHLTIEHLPTDMKEVLQIFENIDNILDIESKFVEQEEGRIEGHRSMLEEYAEEGDLKIITDAFLELLTRLEGFHSELLDIKGDLVGFEIELRDTPAGEWDSDSLQDFIATLPGRLEFEGKELFTQEKLIEHLNKAVRKNLLPGDEVELHSVIDFLLDRSHHIFRLQSLMMDELSFLAD